MTLVSPNLSSSLYLLARWLLFPMSSSVMSVHVPYYLYDVSDTACHKVVNDLGKGPSCGERFGKR